LLELLRQHNWSHGAKPKVVSYKTQDERRTFLFAFFRELRKDPERAYRIDPRSLGRRHIEHAVRRWIGRGLSAGTIHCYLSFLRVFVTWIGKPGLVVEPAAYANDPARVKRSYSAADDKSWCGNQIDINAVFERVDRVDARVGAQLRLCDAFGLRAKEAMMIRPHQAVVGGQLAVVNEREYEAYLEVLRGTKGGRLRFVPITSERQNAALEHAYTIVTAPHQSLAHPGMNLEQAYVRFYYVLRVCGITKAGLGVTAHGLRHGFAHRRYQDHTGSPAPIRGGAPSSHDADDCGRLATSRELGHGRTSICSAYLGGRLQQGQGRPGPIDDEGAQSPDGAADE
jgi:integrase